MNSIYLENNLWDGVCHCLICNLFLGYNNPRQLCSKSYCSNEDLWYSYDIKKSLLYIYNKHDVNNKLKQFYPPSSEPSSEPSYKKRRLE